MTAEVRHNAAPVPVTADDDEVPVTVPVRPPAGPFDAPECAEVPAEAAGHWDWRCWHDRPPA